MLDHVTTSSHASEARTGDWIAAGR